MQLFNGAVRIEPDSTSLSSTLRMTTETFRFPSSALMFIFTWASLPASLCTLSWMWKGGLRLACKCVRRQKNQNEGLDPQPPSHQLAAAKSWRRGSLGSRRHARWCHADRNVKHPHRGQVSREASSTLEPDGCCRKEMFPPNPPPKHH